MSDNDDATNDTETQLQRLTTVVLVGGMIAAVLFRGPGWPVVGIVALVAGAAALLRTEARRTRWLAYGCIALGLVLVAITLLSMFALQMGTEGSAAA